MRKRYAKILIYNTAFPGDIILTTPLVRAVYNRFPGAYIAFCTTPSGVRLLAGLSYLDRLIVYDKHSRDKGIRGLLRTALQLRNERFDLAFSVHRSARTAFLLRLAGIPERIGFAQSALPGLYTSRVERPREVHETLRNIGLLAPFGVNPSLVPTRPMLPVTGEEANHVFGILGIDLPRGDGPVVLVAPGSVWGTKRWLAESYGRLIDELTSQLGARVIMVGTTTDREQAQKVLDSCGSSVLDMVGMTDLRELCALVRKADLVITGDSAPMHVAWAFDIPTVAIFGSTVPGLGFAPDSERCRVVELKGLECRPCSDHGPQACPLGHFQCMKGVSVEMVFSACREMIDLGRAPAGDVAGKPSR
ncbi:MAG: glycosyltransferase family 9 protein [Candidatus Glassbacteria bacterium]|nr:glycosyltransferase family 9 protein [Candidatus Glassbacteria bacterium]